MEQDREGEGREPVGWVEELVEERAAEAAGDGWGDLSREPDRVEDASARVAVPPPPTRLGFLVFK